MQHRCSCKREGDGVGEHCCPAQCTQTVEGVNAPELSLIMGVKFREGREDRKDNRASPGEESKGFIKKGLSSLRDHLKNPPPFDISCVSVKKKNPQSLSAKVEEKSPSPRKNRRDSVDSDTNAAANDRDHPVNSSSSLIKTVSLESFDSGISMKSDCSRDIIILFAERPPFSRLDFSTDEEDVFAVDDLESSNEMPLQSHNDTYDGLEVTGSKESLQLETNIQRESREESGASFGSDGSKNYKTCLKKKFSLFWRRIRMKRHQERCEKSTNRVRDRALLRIWGEWEESSDSGVSLKSDQSAGRTINFKETPPVRTR